MKKRGSTVSLSSWDQCSSSQSSFGSVPATPARHGNVDASFWGLDDASPSSSYTQSPVSPREMSWESHRLAIEHLWLACQKPEPDAAVVPAYDYVDPSPALSHSMHLKLAFQELDEQHALLSQGVGPSMTEDSSFAGMESGFAPMDSIDMQPDSSSSDFMDAQPSSTYEDDMTEMSSFPLQGSLAQARKRRQNRRRQNRRRQTPRRGQLPGVNPCPHPGCTAKFSRSEHLNRHRKSHDPLAKVHECGLKTFFGHKSCPLMANRIDNRSQHHFTHCKGGKSRNVVVEPEVMMQCVMRLHADEDDEENGSAVSCTGSTRAASNAYGRSLLGFLVANDLKPHRDNLWLGVENTGPEDSGWRPSRGVSSKHHIDHEDMAELGFPACLPDLSEMECEKSSHGTLHRVRRFQYADWFHDENGCLWVYDLNKQGDLLGWRCLCGSFGAPPPRKSHR